MANKRRRARWAYKPRTPPPGPLTPMERAERLVEALAAPDARVKGWALAVDGLQRRLGRPLSEGEKLNLMDFVLMLSPDLDPTKKGPTKL